MNKYVDCRTCKTDCVRADGVFGYAYCDQYTPKTTTNADHIRGMSDDELAELICTADWCNCCDQQKNNGTCMAMEKEGPLNKYCVEGALKWLRQPWEGDNNA